MWHTLAITNLKDADIPHETYHTGKWIRRQGLPPDRYGHGARSDLAHSEDNVKVGLLPTFQDICATHHLDRSFLVPADISSAVLDMMQGDEPVPEKHANAVLKAVCQLTGENYSIADVDIALEEV